MAYPADYRNKPFTSSTGKSYATDAGEARGNWEREYLTPGTTQDRATSLYNTYGSRYGWQPLSERLAPPPAAAPAPAPTAAEPTPAPPAAAPMVDNSSILFPGTTGQLPPVPQAPNISMAPVADIPAPPRANISQQLGSISDFIPKNVEASPLYEWQKNEANKSVQQMAAARGLTNSGAEFQAMDNALSKIRAEETERQRAFATQEAANRFQGLNADAISGDANYNSMVKAYQARLEAENSSVENQINNYKTQLLPWQMTNELAQLEANRFAEVGQNESTRLTGQSNEYFDRQYKLLDLMLRNNPMAQAYGATGALGNLYQSTGSGLAGYLSPSGGGGGGGGNGPMPFLPPPVYQGPRPSDAEAGKQSSNANKAWIDLLGGYFGSEAGRKNELQKT